MARRPKVRITPGRSGRGKTFMDPVIDAVGKAAKDYTDRQMRALTNMEVSRDQVEGFLRPSNRNR